MLTVAAWLLSTRARPLQVEDEELLELVEMEVTPCALCLCSSALPARRVAACFARRGVTCGCVALQVRELLSAHEFPGDDIPVIRGSALMALEGERDEIGKDAVRELMNQVSVTLTLTLAFRLRTLALRLITLAPRSGS